MNERSHPLQLTAPVFDLLVYVLFSVSFNMASLLRFYLRLFYSSLYLDFLSVELFLFPWHDYVVKLKILVLYKLPQKNMRRLCV